MERCPTLTAISATVCSLASVAHVSTAVFEIRPYTSLLSEAAASGLSAWRDLAPRRH